MRPSTRLQGLLNQTLAAQRDKTALRCGDRRLSYAELDDAVGRMASGLKRSGIKPGDRVMWFLPNCLEAVVSTLACYRTGAVSLPINYRYVGPELRFVFDRTAPSLLICHRDRLDVIADAKLDPTTLPTFVVAEPGGEGSPALPAWSDLLSGVDSAGNADLDEETPALILFTSGSTGHPKGVTHTHRSAWWAIESSRQALDIRAPDTVLVGKPISHAGGLQTQLLPTLAAGGECIIEMKPTPQCAAQLIQRHSVTQYGMLASDLLDFIEYLEQSGEHLPSLRNSIGSGDSVPVELHHRFRDLFGWEVLEGSGMTEIGSYYAMNPRYGERKWGSLGLPTPGTTLDIVDSDGMAVPPGEVGEIELKTEASTTGYWDDPDGTTALFRDGWLRTGDLGRFDQDGYVWFVGRSKLMIVRRGSNIAPAEIENVLDAHPKVHASVVVGVVDARDGHVPVAWVAPMGDSAGPDSDTLRAYVAERLAPYQVPVRYLFTRELPRNTTGKFDRNRLQQLAERAMSKSFPPDTLLTIPKV